MSWTILPLYFTPFARQQSLPVKFIVSGQGTEGGNWAVEAYDYASGHIAQQNLDGQFLQSLQNEKMIGWDKDGNQMFEMVATYGPSAASESPAQAVVDGRADDEAHATLIGSRMFGSESRIEVAKAANRFPDTLPDHGLIIKTADGIGCPVLDTQGDLTLQKRLPLADVSDYLKDVLEPLITPRPSMNNATFWGRPAGSLLIVDYDLTIQGKEGVVNGHFQYKPNLTSATIAGITSINANGHDHIEAVYETKIWPDPPVVGQKIEKVRSLLGFYVYQIYDLKDFGDLKMTEPT